MLKLSIVIPAYNEEGSIAETVQTLYEVLQKYKIDHEIVVINDNSKDNTIQVLQGLQQQVHSLVYYTNDGPNGFGYAVRYGLEKFSGDCVAVMMADLSDDPVDLVRFYHRMLEDNVDCVFGSRFIKGGKLIDYPFHKFVINRMANTIIRMVIGTRYNDATNAFKLYKKETIAGIQPLMAPHFNLTIELSLKTIVRGYTYTVVPNSWRNRKAGVSKLKIREMGSRYFFILMYCFIEKFFSRGDYKKNILHTDSKVK
ncbi:glycosyltransferase family 2 protein [Lacibacter sediminis]|uniref:Glycosyltransferase family 2 protein n=1 Tax=Lacibacter sediminis TaxID=2760713 RepID=A0A7G5XHQ0_9BACT|nr:glycosyltransferase family 2 protein [Lacibacter sediminis]QNA45003.1 glycosyltransferase family 2 protein [Lacibacter sediminis]